MNSDHRDPKKNGDDIAALIRLAGGREPVPSERAQRVRAAARERWRSEVHRGARRRYAWGVAALAAAAVIVVGVFVGTNLWRAAPPAALASIVESVVGEAWTSGSAGVAAPRPLVVGDAVPGDAEIRTGESGAAALRLASGHSLRLAGSTQVRLLDDGTLELERGTLYLDSGSDAIAADGLVVRTRHGVIEEIGTQFEVRLEDASVRVRLREGAVLVRHEGNVEQVDAGFELELDAMGQVTRRRLSPFGAEWNWIVGVTPMIDLEGRSAREFLDWVARERGLTVAYTDTDVARAAQTTVLSGTVGRLTLEEALDAVLPTCRMTYRIDDGVLVVSADPTFDSTG